MYRVQTVCTFCTRTGVGTNISFSPEGISGTAFFDQASWTNPTVSRIVAVLIDASWTPRLASDKARLIPIPAQDYDFMKEVYGVLPWGAGEPVRAEFLKDLRAYATTKGYAVEQNQGVEKPQLPDAPAPMMPNGGDVAALSSLVEKLTKQVSELQQQRSPVRKSPNTAGNNITG